ncbi:hypothetical protein LUZ63_016645 [Rhynchospora breviuscula]|uniref:Uncharacterized protein n=1 Tax=Rhynchospora breviuscula TaxID=2022672 RepID=A0A9P9ZA92_9POAL|nr:hypothetical protein LUZ63_016645 [Rhynchospora breviuscula]
MQKQFSLFLSTTLILSLSLIRPNQAKIRIVIGSVTDSTDTTTNTCQPSGYISSRKPGSCTAQNNDSCCKDGQSYPKYQCSPPVTAKTDAIMYINTFSDAPSSCEPKIYNDDELVVSLSTGWYDKGTRCLKSINITTNGNSVLAKVVDQCDSINGCTAEVGYEKPCGANEIRASRGVWSKLYMVNDQMGTLEVTWSDVSSS